MRTLETRRRPDGSVYRRRECTSCRRRCSSTEKVDWYGKAWDRGEVDDAPPAAQPARHLRVVRS